MKEDRRRHLSKEQLERELEHERSRRAANAPAFITGIEFDNEDITSLVKKILGDKPWVDTMVSALGLKDGNYAIGRLHNRQERRRKKNKKMLAGMQLQQR